MAFYGIRAGIRDWIEGERHYSDLRGYLSEIDELRGSTRCWFFWVKLDRNEPAWIRDYLGTIGREVEQIPDGELESCGAVLFDLSDPTRLELATADSFPLMSDAAE